MQWVSWWAISPPRARWGSRTAILNTGRATSSGRSTSGTRPSRAAASRRRSRPSPATWASTRSRAPKAWDAPPRPRWWPRWWRNDRADRRPQALPRERGAGRRVARGEGRRDPRAARAVRSGEERHPEDDQRPAAARLGRRDRGRAARAAAGAQRAGHAALQDRLRVPVRRAVRLDERGREHPARYNRREVL